MGPLAENNCNFDDFVVHALRCCNTAGIEVMTCENGSKKVVRPIINGHYIFLNFGSETHPVLIDTEHPLAW